MSTQARSLLFLLVVLTLTGVGCCAWTGTRLTSYTQPDVTRSFVLIRTDKGNGMGVLVKDNLVVTAKHVVEGATMIVAGGRRGFIHHAPIGYDIALVLMADDLDNPGLDMALPVPGLAEVIYYAHGSLFFDRVLIDSGEHIPGNGIHFSGWIPVPGQSGSPVIQDGKLVGVVAQTDIPNGGYLETVAPLLVR